MSRFDVVEPGVFSLDLRPDPVREAAVAVVRAWEDAEERAGSPDQHDALTALRQALRATAAEVEGAKRRLPGVQGRVHRVPEWRRASLDGQA